MAQARVTTRQCLLFGAKDHRKPWILSRGFGHLRPQTVAQRDAEELEPPPEVRNAICGEHDEIDAVGSDEYVIDIRKAGENMVHRLCRRWRKENVPSVVCVERIAGRAV